MAISSKQELTESGLQYHIRCKKGDVGRYVLLPGDPFRTDLIASYLDNAKVVAHNREHKTWTGYLGGEKVSVTSTGMGGPSAAIAVEELIHCGADTFIRVGTCGRICKASFDPALEGCVITGAIRQEGTTIEYVPIEYPAMADRHIVEALVQAAKSKGYNYAEGIGQSKDSFYGQIDPDSMPAGNELKMKWEAWEKANVMASEMESAALFIVSQIRGTHAGAIMAYGAMTDHTIEVAIEAMKTLIAKDHE